MTTYKFTTKTDIHGLEFVEEWNFVVSLDSDVTVRLYMNEERRNRLGKTKVPLEEVPDRAMSQYIEQLRDDRKEIEQIIQRHS